MNPTPDLMAHQEYISLLQSLIKELSLSGSEEKTADLIQIFLSAKNIVTERLHNNIVARNQSFDKSLPTIILNSHHDTVKIGNGWTKDPLGAEIEEGKLYGRGSNDAGGALVALIATFCHFYKKILPYNLMLIASGEEENFGNHGVSSILKSLDFKPGLGIIGEPTEMQLAIAEKGLIVIDGLAEGISGHSARDGGLNAIYLANEDITWIRNHKWDKISEVLGATKTTVTQVSGGSQHNVIPDMCSYVIDCRVNERYTLQEVLDVLQKNTKAKLTPRSLKWHPSGIALDHAIVKKGVSKGLSYFGSPTLSDQVHFECPTVKIGPGRSQRSHTPDEFIFIKEIEEGIDIYIDLLEGLKITG